MTIDGVANIDTGDNGGNMATTNIDAVAEFKVLTNAYQAEYGRAVGAQVQVVTKSGTPGLPRVRLLVRPPVGLERQHVDQQALGGAGAVGTQKLIEPPSLAQRLRLHPRRSRLHPGLQREQEEAVLLLERGVAEAQGPVANARHPRSPPRSSAPATSPRASTVAATPSLHPRLHRAANLTWRLQRDDPRLLRGRRRARQDPGEPALPARHRGPQHLPPAQLTARQRPQLHEPGAGDPPRREDLLRLDFQPSDTWHVTGRYMNEQRRRSAALRHHAGPVRRQHRHHRRLRTLCPARTAWSRPRAS